MSREEGTWMGGCMCIKKIKFILEQVIKAHREHRGIAQLFL
jgi:hypothetical protein